MNHTMVALVENKPGVLARVALLFRRRNYNIESLTVCQTESPDLSRMTIVVDTPESEVRSVEHNLRKLINVVDVENVTHKPVVARDLALIKVKADSATRAEISQLTDIFRAKIVDVTADSVIVEVTGDEQKIDGFVDLVRSKGILEMARTGRVAMARGNGNGDVKANVTMSP